MNWLKRYREPLMYLFFGVVTTVLNLLVFKLCNLLLGDALYLVSNVIAWAAAVITAYVTNKLWVFESKSWAPTVLAREIPAFAGARVFSLLIEEAGLFLTIDLLGWDRWSLSLLFFTVGGQMICKFLMQVIVVILNYVFSKLIIFKKK